MGATALAISVGATAWFGIVFGTVLIVSGAPPWGVAMVLVGLAAWLAGAFDARSRAGGRSLLRPAMLTAAFGGEFGFLIAAALQASNRN